MINLLKLHLFLFYASTACFIVFLTVYYKNYTDATYDEIGTLLMLCALAGAFMKPLVCSIADRHNSYKQCLMTSLFVFGLATVPLSVLPFYPQILFQEPHSRLIWYLVAMDSLFAFASLGIGITLNDVFIMHNCSNSTTGEHFGQYRFIGSLGWATSALCLAFTEQYINLPYMVLPMMSTCVITLVDLMLLTQVQNIGGRNSLGMRVAISNESLNLGKQAPPLAKISVHLNATKPLTKVSRDCSTLVKAELNCSNHIKSTTSAPAPFRSSLVSTRCEEISTRSRVRSIGTRGSNERISLSVQLNLLLRLNRHDSYNLVKYLLLFVIMGALSQVHYVFYLQFMTEILKEYNMISLFFIYSAIIQVADATGGTLSLLWIAPYAIGFLGRDKALMLCIVLSGIRYAFNAFLIDYLNIWMVAAMDVQTGIIFGIIYTLMTETASCYLSLLDKLLLIETESNSDDEINFVARLEELKLLYSIESIRFALKATFQSILSGACEGIGFALGPLIAGFWLYWRGNSLKMLYQDVAYLHLFVLLTAFLLEFGLIRLLFGAHSKVDRLRIGHQVKL